MPEGWTPVSTTFATVSFVEAALMMIRKKPIECVWRGRTCTFSFPDVGENDIQFATNPDTMVTAREFNHALSQVKAIMYESKPE